MTKFARQENGAWCDPKEASSLAALDTQYHPDWVASHKAAGTWFQAVSDAVFDQLMPPPSVPVTIDIEFARSEFVASIRRRADAMAKSGNPQGALLLLSKHGL